MRKSNLLKIGVFILVLTTFSCEHENENKENEITNSKIKKFDSSNSSIPNSSVVDIIFDELNNIWIGTEESGIAKMDKNLEILELMNYENGKLYNNYVRSMNIDQNNNLWIGSILSFWSFDGNHWEIYSESLPSTSFDGIAFDSNNDKWICTGIGILKLSGDSLTHITSFNSDIPGASNHIIVDKNDVVWIASGGLTKYDHGQIFTYTPDNSSIASKWIRSLEMDEDGSIWIATGMGLNNLSGEEWELFNTENSIIQDNNIWDLEYSAIDSSIYFTAGSNEEYKLYKINSEGLIECLNDQYPELNDEFPKTVSIDRENRIFLGLMGGGILVITG
jgi:ligand-binding sensor domain-containing protein